MIRLGCVVVLVGVLCAAVGIVSAATDLKCEERAAASGPNGGFRCLCPDGDVPQQKREPRVNGCGPQGDDWLKRSVTRLAAMVAEGPDKVRFSNGDQLWNFHTVCDEHDRCCTSCPRCLLVVLFDSREVLL